MDDCMKIKTSFAEPGMVVGKDVYSSDDHMIVNAGTVLTDRMITRLKFYSISEIIIATPEVIKNKRRQESLTQKPVVSDKMPSYIERVKAQPQFKQFTKTFYATFVSYKEQVTDVVQNKAPLNADAMLEDVSKVFASCKNPNSLLDMMMCIRNLDDATYVHSMNVALICKLFAKWLKLDAQKTRNLTLAGLLHDIGKLLIPVEILKKPGKLTEEEYRIIQEHPMLGYNILINQNVDQHVCMAALMHHERCDGNGYPGKLTRNEIDPYAKIVAIADVYDALTATRVYRGPVCPLEVISIFQTEGLTLYDPKYLLTFLDQIMYSYLHHTVRLSNGEVGKIVMMNRNSLNRPIIKITNDWFIDLTVERDITVTGIL